MMAGMSFLACRSIRSISGFFVAPIVGALIWLQISPHAFALSVPIAYFGMIVVGIPAYAALTRRKVISFWAFVAAGISCALLTGAFFLLLFSGDKALFYVFLSRVIANGGLSGLVFWLVARPDLATRV